MHGLREVTSERQVISHDPSVTSFFIGPKWQEMHDIHLLLLTYVLVEMECY